MTTNPEQSVLDEIDALVDEQMAGGEYAAIERTESVVTDVDRCALCKGAWHGAPWTGIDHDHLGEYDRHNHGRSLRCPGAFATGPQRIRYRWQRQGRRRGTSAGRPWLVSIGQNHPPASRGWDNLGNPMRDLGEYAVRAADSFQRLNDPIYRAQCSVESAYNALDALGAWEGANMEPQPLQLAPYRRVIDEYLRRIASQLGIPTEALSVRPQGITAPNPIGPDGRYRLSRASLWDADFQCIGDLADADGVTMAIDAPDIESFGGVEVRGPGPIADYVVRDTATDLCDSSAMEGITMRKRFMQSARGGRETMKHFGGLTLMSYWGAPSAAGTWWELDLWNGRVWKSIDVQTEIENVHDVRSRTRRGQTFPPTRSTFIELAAQGTYHINPIGVIAVGATNRDGSHHILRAYVKSHTNDPPVLYDDNRHPARHQPTSWARRDLPVGRHPQQLVAMIREAEHL